MDVLERWGENEPWQPTRAQEKAAWCFADCDGGCLVRSLGDGRDELLTVQKGECRWYLISGDGEALLVESYPRTWRYWWGWGLSICGAFFFVAFLAVGLYAFEDPNGELPAFVALPAVFALCLAVVGRLISPHVRHVQTPPGERWTELRYATTVEAERTVDPPRAIADATKAGPAPVA